MANNFPDFYKNNKLIEAAQTGHVQWKPHPTTSTSYYWKSVIKKKILK